MTKFSFYVTCISIVSIAFSTPLAGQSWTLLIVPGIYFFTRHVKENGWKQFYKRKSQLFLLFFIMSIILSNLINLDVHSDPVRGFKKIRYLIVCFFNLYTLDFLIGAIGTRKKAKLLARLLIYGFTISTIYAYVSFYFKYDFIKMVPENLGNRVTGITGIMNYGYETPIVAFLCLTAGFYFYEKEKIGLGLLNALGVLFSGVRGGVLALMGGLPFLVYYHFKKYFKVFVVFCIACAFTFTFIMVTKRINPLMIAGQRHDSPISTLTRLKLHEIGFMALKDRPILGHGLLNHKDQYPFIVRYKGQDVKYGGLLICESTYLQVLVDMGLVGFILYLAFLFFWVKELIQRKDVMTYLLVPSVFAFLISSFVHTMFVSGTTTAALLGWLYNFSVIDEGGV